MAAKRSITKIKRFIVVEEMERLQPTFI